MSLGRAADALPALHAPGSGSLRAVAPAPATESRPAHHVLATGAADDDASDRLQDLDLNARRHRPSDLNARHHRPSAHAALAISESFDAVPALPAQTSASLRNPGRQPQGAAHVAWSQPTQSRTLSLTAMRRMQTARRVLPTDVIPQRRRARITTRQSVANLLSTGPGNQRAQRIVRRALESLERHDREVSERFVDDETGEEISVLTPTRARKVTPAIFLSLAVQLFALWLGYEELSSRAPCSTNAELACACDGGSRAVSFAVEQLALNWPYRAAIMGLALRLTGTFDPRWAVLVGLLQSLAALGVQVAVHNSSASNPNGATYLLTKLFCEIGVIVAVDWRVRGTPFHKRAWPLIAYTGLLAGSGLAVIMLVRVLAGVSTLVRDVALVTVPVQLSMWTLFMVQALKGGTIGYSATELSMLARLVVALYEGIRMGMLLVSAADGTGLVFVLSLLCSCVVEVIARNDLFVTGVRKLVFRWSDEQVAERFTLTKELFLAARFDAEYMPLFAVGALQATNYLGTTVMLSCKGEVFDFYNVSFTVFALVLFANVITDMGAVQLAGFLGRHRPLLVRDMSGSLPHSRLLAALLGMGCLAQAVAGLGVVAFMYDASEWD